MPKIHFGHCVGCDQPIRPPYLSFKVSEAVNDGSEFEEWEDVDVCNDCAGKLTAEDLHRLVDLPEEEDTESQQGADERRGGYASSSPSLSEPTNA